MFWNKKLTVDDFRTNTEQKKLKTVRAWTLQENDTSNEFGGDYDDGYDDNGREVVEEEQ